MAPVPFADKNVHLLNYDGSRSLHSLGGVGDPLNLQIEKVGDNTIPLTWRVKSEGSDEYSLSTSDGSPVVSKDTGGSSGTPLNAGGSSGGLFSGTPLDPSGPGLFSGTPLDPAGPGLFSGTPLGGLFAGTPLNTGGSSAGAALPQAIIGASNAPPMKFKIIKTGDASPRYIFKVTDKDKALACPLQIGSLVNNTAAYAIQYDQADKLQQWSVVVLS
ncbi:hypothetical protein K439DRAFT_1615746 [Ramaria rubella]|nr:hypothetical protein K439DRAFT_1615746 [Ramaria rubella]